MKRLLPDRVELAILGILALVTALVAGLCSEPQVGLAFGSMPLYVTACLMGMRRNGQLSARPRRDDSPTG